METDSMADLLNSVFPLNPGTTHHIKELACRVQYIKGQVITSPGKPADEMWYIVRGLAKEYYYDPSGKCVITSFWKEHELMLVAESFFCRTSSCRYIELLENSIMLCLTYRNVLRLQIHHPELHLLGYHILSTAKQKSDLRGDMLIHSAKERYQLFCVKFPWNRISVTDTAAYLGLTRETVSVVRSGKLNIGTGVRNTTPDDKK